MWILGHAKNCACIVLSLPFRAELDLASQHIYSEEQFHAFRLKNTSYVNSKNHHLEHLISTICLFHYKISSLLLNLQSVIWGIWNLDYMEYLSVWRFKKKINKKSPPRLFGYASENVCEVLSFDNGEEQKHCQNRRTLCFTIYLLYSSFYLEYVFFL